VRIPNEVNAGIAIATLSYRSEQGKAVAPATILFRVPAK
jgi:hypothetical protein